MARQLQDCRAFNTTFLLLIAYSIISCCSGTKIAQEDADLTFHVTCTSGPVPSDWMPAHSDPRIYAASSLTVLCASYPEGFGLRCTSRGALQYRRPLSPLLVGPFGEENTRMANHCRTNCECSSHPIDLTSSTGSPAAEMLNSTLSEMAGDWEILSDDGLTEEPVMVNHPNPNPDWHDSGFHRTEPKSVTCSDWFGSPKLSDCQAAREQLNRLNTMPLNRARLVQLYAQNARPSPGYIDLPIPKKFSYGDCIIAIIPPDDPVYYDIYTHEQVLAPPDDIIEHCVSAQNLGGRLQWVTDDRGASTHGRLDDLAPTYVVYSISSSFNRYWVHSFSSAVDVYGTAVVRHNKADATKVGMHRKGSTFDVASMPGTGNGCSKRSDCSNAQDSICAQAEIPGLTVSQVWDRFTCIRAVQAAAAIAVSISFPSCRKSGRCLLEADGSVIIQNATNSTSEYLVPATGSLNNDTVANSSTTSSNIDIATSTTISYPAVITGVAMNTESDLAPTNSTLSDVTEPAHSWSNTLDPDAGLFMICPCNCTYYAHACCFDEIVFADMDKAIPDMPQETRPGLVCDTISGEWLNQTTVQQSSTSGSSFPPDVPTSTATLEMITLQTNIPVAPQQAAILASPLAAHPSNTPEVENSVCAASGAWCSSFWGCGNPDHCYCAQIIPGTLIYRCAANIWHKSPSPPPPQGGHRHKRGVGDLTLEPRICPCNCTYTSNSCCDSPSGLVWEDPVANKGPIILPAELLCNTTTGSIDKI